VEHTKSLNCISRKKIREIKSHTTQEKTFTKHLLDENTHPTSLPNQRSYFYPLTTYAHTYFVTYSWTTNTVPHKYTILYTRL